MNYIPQYFSEAEFLKCKPSCSISDMDSKLLHFLDRVRDSCKFPIVINSAYRTKEYELKKGRSGTSSHCKGKAVDIRCTDSFKRARIIGVVCELSNLFTGIPLRLGIGKDFIHLDIDIDKPEGIWVY